MRVLLNDGMDREGIEIFEKANIEADVKKRKEDELLQEIEEFDALCVRSSTKVTKEVIEEGAKGKLKVIGRAGVGYDNIDIVAAGKNGIIVKYAPSGNTNAAAELALGLMLAVSRNIPQAHYTLKNKIWIKKKFEGIELAHKTLGIIGCGRIGQRLAELVRGFDMKVIGYDDILDSVKTRFPDSRIEYLEKEQVIREADFLSVHTGGKNIIIGRKELGLMKPASFIINCSRGSNVDGEALYEFLRDRKIAGAGLDVYASEPKDGEKFENKLQGLENVVLTSHLGASTKEAQIKTSIEMATLIRDYLLKGDFSNAVNIKEAERKEAEERLYSLFVYHEDKPGVFGKISKVLGDDGINIKENPSNPLGDARYAATVYLTYQPVGKETIEKLKNLKEIKSVKV